MLVIILYRVCRARVLETEGFEIKGEGEASSGFSQTSPTPLSLCMARGVGLIFLSRSVRWKRPKVLD